MTALRAETWCALRRLARRPTARGALVMDLVLLAYAAFVHPVAAASDALWAATEIASLTLLVAAAGILADDRERGRLAVPATHPPGAAVWVTGRWLAVWAVAAGTLLLSVAALLPVASSRGPAAGLLLGVLVAAAHLAALAALAVGLSCRLGSTAQVLLLVALLVIGALPPAIAGVVAPEVPLEAEATVLWSVLPTPWALSRLREWTLGGAAAPLQALALALQPWLWLGTGARHLAGVELAPRGM